MTDESRDGAGGRLGAVLSGVAMRAADLREVVAERLSPTDPDPMAADMEGHDARPGAAARLVAGLAAIPRRRRIAFAGIGTVMGIAAMSSLLGGDGAEPVGLIATGDADAVVPTFDARTVAAFAQAPDVTPAAAELAGIIGPPLPPSIAFDGISGLRETQASTGAACAVKVEAMPLAAATIALEIEAPCDPAARIDVIQGALHVAVSADAQGRASVELPALLPQATFAVLVGDRDPVTVVGEALDFQGYARATLQRDQLGALELHVFEDNADYGAPGHVSATTPRTVAHVLSGNGGFIRAIGDPDLADPRTAVVYTRPIERVAELSLEAAVTEATCARDVMGAVILSGPGLTAEEIEIDLTLPACDAAGTFVMLGDPAAAVVSLAAD